jgi:hypothetical protein
MVWESPLSAPQTASQLRCQENCSKCIMTYRFTIPHHSPCSINVRPPPTRVRRSLAMARSRTTEQQFLYSLNGCNILRCRTCRLGQAQTPDFDAASYYTGKYFSGQQSDGYADYLAAEPVLRREFARTVAFIRQWWNGGRLLKSDVPMAFPA